MKATNKINPWGKKKKKKSLLKKHMKGDQHIETVSASTRKQDAKCHLE